MKDSRLIRENEKTLVAFLLKKLELKLEEYPIGENVIEYEDGKMGSITFGNGDSAAYAGDLIQAHYTDTDNIPVVITLTIDNENKLLDLDFWKDDFSKLLRYPETGDLKFSEL
jgi:hypothetical protein